MGGLPAGCRVEAFSGPPPCRPPHPARGAGPLLQHILGSILFPSPQRRTFLCAFLFKFAGMGHKLTVESTRWANLAEQHFFSSSPGKGQARPRAPHQGREGFGQTNSSIGKKEHRILSPFQGLRVPSLKLVSPGAPLGIFGKGWCQASRQEASHTSLHWLQGPAPPARRDQTR